MHFPNLFQISFLSCVHLSFLPSVYLALLVISLCICASVFVCQDPLLLARDAPDFTGASNKHTYSPNRTAFYRFAVETHVDVRAHASMHACMHAHEYTHTRTRTHYLCLTGSSVDLGQSTPFNTVWTGSSSVQAQPYVPSYDPVQPGVGGMSVSNRVCDVGHA